MSHRISRVLYLLVPLALLAGFILRPTPIVGADGESLAASTGAPVNEIGSVPCEEQGEDSWTCTNPGTQESDPNDPNATIFVGKTTYEVKVDTWGCWTISNVNGPAEPPEKTGCVTMMDHVESID
jgi:hypothetical protein